MLGEILVITENHKKAGEQIVDILNGIMAPKFVIAIGGESGAGKSAIAHVISKRLKTNGESAKIINLDNYYKVPAGERTRWRKSHLMDKIGWPEYDWDHINQNIDEFRKDKRATLPCIDLRTGQEDRLITDFKGIRFLILDGLYSLKASANLRIFIDLSYRETLEAQVIRGKETLDDFRSKVLEREHEAVQSLKPLADLIITKSFDVVEAK